LHVEPRSFPVLFKLGLAYFKAGTLRQPSSRCRKRRSRSLTTFKLERSWGCRTSRPSSTGPASEQFEKLAAAQPDNSTFSYLPAESYLWSDQEEKMLGYFQQVLERLPDSVTMHMLLGEADDGLDRTTDAIQEFEAAAKLAPEQPDVRSA